MQYLVLVTGCVSVGKINESEVFKISQVSLVSLRGPQTVEEERVTELRKLLSSGTFYFLWSSNGEPQDITLSTQKVQQGSPTENRFFWNRYMFLLHVNGREIQQNNILFYLSDCSTYHCSVMVSAALSGCCESCVVVWRSELFMLGIASSRQPSFRD